MMDDNACSRELVRLVMAQKDIRTFHPALVREIGGMAALALRNAIGQPEWRNVDPKDVAALADYLEIGPNERIPDDEAALLCLARFQLIFHETGPRSDA